MAAVRGRTLTTFGGFLMPVGLSGGSEAPPAAVIHLAASYDPTLPLAASYDPTLPLGASYDPTIPLEAHER